MYDSTKYMLEKESFHVDLVWKWPQIEPLCRSVVRHRAARSQRPHSPLPTHSVMTPRPSTA